MRNTIIHLIGHPGVGKYTVAQEIASLVDVRVLDNHLVANPIFSLLARNSAAPISAEVWARIGVIRDLMLLTMEDRSPPELNFVLTNVINDEPGDVAVFKRILRMVAARSATFVPVVLDCATDEHLKRIPKGPTWNSQQSFGERTVRSHKPSVPSLAVGVQCWAAVDARGTLEAT